MRGLRYSHFWCSVLHLLGNSNDDEPAVTQLKSLDVVIGRVNLKECKADQNLKTLKGLLIHIQKSLLLAGRSMIANIS